MVLFEAKREHLLFLAMGEAMDEAMDEAMGEAMSEAMDEAMRWLEELHLLLVEVGFLEGVGLTALQ